MNYKPNEGTLMAYLYGELDAAETEKVIQYLNQHPDELQKLEQMMDTLKLLKGIQDKEVIAPSIVSDLPAPQISFWQTGMFKTWMSIAASFILILVVARLIGPEISYSEGELRISFNQSKPQQEVALNQNEILTSVQIQEMINQSLIQNNNSVQASWNENQQRLEKSIQGNFAANTARISELMKTTSQASQDQVRRFVAGLQEENLKNMKDYLQLSANDQNAYVEALLVDFSKYLQEQRKQDFQMFQTRMANIEKNTDQFKQETEQILAGIITNPEVSIKRVSNY
jgi:CHASE3 domain sensor protein